MEAWEPITEREFRLLLADNVLRLDGDTFARWERIGVDPVHIPCERRNLVGGGPPAREAVFVVARAGDEVLFYDDVEEEFGVGRLDPDGVLRDWGTYGQELRWAMKCFPSGPDAPAV